MSVTRRQGARLPREAGGLRLRVHDQSARRSRERWGFDLNAGDALDRARGLAAAAPGDAAAALLLSAALASRGQTPTAEAEARRAVELDPTGARAWTTLASLLMSRGADREALEAARRAVELDPGDVLAQYNRGLAEWAAGDHAAARTALRLAGGLLDPEPGGGGAPRWLWPFGRSRRPAVPPGGAGGR